MIVLVGEIRKMLKRLINWLGIKPESKPVVSIIVVMQSWYISKVKINNMEFSRGQWISPSDVLNTVLDYIQINYGEKISFTDPEWNALFASLNSRSPVNITLNKVQVNITFEKAHQIQL